jgi:hypothetical protein
MKPASFRYFAPHRVDEALDLLAAHGEEGKILRAVCGPSRTFGGVTRYGWFESGFLQQRVCKLSVPHESSCGSK